MYGFIMARMSVFLGAIYLLLTQACIASASAQYFHDWDKVAFSMAVNSWHNISTNASDLVVSLGYQKLSDDGWLALGFGSSMRGALMFITYKVGDQLVLDTRNSPWNDQPFQRLAGERPEVETLSLTQNSSGWFETSFACYACTNSDNSTKFTGTTIQPWIFSQNLDQTFQSTTDNLIPHRRVGHILLNMTAEESGSESPYIPSLASDLSIPPPDELDHGDFSTTLFRFHGVLLAVSIMLLYPCGALVIRSGIRKVFQMHLIFQISASLMCLAGGIIAVYGIWTNHLHMFLDKPHVILGITILILISVQILLGYLHHKGFVHSRSNPVITMSHVWLGRCIIVSGGINALLGLRLAGSTTRLLILVLIGSLVDVVIVSYLSFKRQKPGTAEEEKDKVPFLDEDIESKLEDLEKSPEERVDR